MLSERISSLKRLSDAKMHRDHTTFRIHSVSDDEFTNILNNQPIGKEARQIITVPVREDNIRLMRDTGRLNTNSKEVHRLMKLGETQNILDYLCTLDDASFKYAARIPAIRKDIESNIALSHRYETIMSQDSPVRVQPSRQRMSFIKPFSLEEEEIKITGDLEEDMNTLLETPESHIEEVLDPEIYHQDATTMRIKTIVMSPEFRQRKARFAEEECACSSPYKSRK